MFCLGIRMVIDTFLVSRIETEDMKRRIAIEVNDERNIRLKEKVGAKINQVVIYLLSIIVLALGFMRAKKIILIGTVMTLTIVSKMMFGCFRR